MESNVAALPLSHKAWAWFEANRKQAVLGAGAVLIIALIAWFVVWQQGEKQIAAGEALSSVSAGQFGAGGSHPGAADAYLKVAAAYPNSSAGARALLLAGGALYAEGKYDDARAQFQRFVQEHRDSPFLSQALLGIAACVDAQGKSAEAITAYKDLVDHHSGEVVVSQAKFALARLYVAQNKLEQAHSLYEEVERTDTYGVLGPEAGMRAAELELKFPNLAPKPAAAATPAVPLTLEKK